MGSFMVTSDGTFAPWGYVDTINIIAQPMVVAVQFINSQISYRVCGFKPGANKIFIFKFLFAIWGNVFFYGQLQLERPSYL